MTLPIPGLLVTALLLMPAGRAWAEATALDVYAAAEAGGAARFSGVPEKFPGGRVALKTSGYARADLMRLAAAKARRYNLSPKLVLAIVTHESNWDTACRGAAGEYSLGQILPSTWEKMREAKKISGNPWLPENNLEATARYISDSQASITQRDLEFAKKNGLQRGHLLMIMYNAGRGSLNKYVAGEPMPQKIISYVRQVVKIHNSWGKAQKRR